MEDLQGKHRKELKDLQSQITQKKKSATKKTRKGVNDECAELERALKQRHQQELSIWAGNSETTQADLGEENGDDDLRVPVEDANGPDRSVEALSPSTGAANSERSRKPNRQKARLARRAAEQEASATQAAKEAEDLPNLRAKEREAMQAHFSSRGLQEHEIQSDGHCLYAAIADQLSNANIELRAHIKVDDPGENDVASKPGYKVTRQVAASYISVHPDDFEPFLEESLTDYVRTIRETGEWGGHLELLALAKAYEVNINVLQGSGHVDKIEGNSKSDAKSLWLAYYRHSFGLGEHYNSLRLQG